ncbi:MULTISPECIES: 2-isopropylmalate synthase [unclassified Lentimonas]|uniref:2-isopropylmalate synthase n=1 Tax=unclassified Lentimonas TaxID=2630993 RepID=UPI001328E1D6|nr:MULTISPECIES: 2-isopropylmalate synthase [unclassified Lentimonas]CAA6677006.1 2-isopropylmalate synthase (EC [Lentimonas sp. CC4]CAA6686812.1 2-isopropylmalate synthase (EC [Lentimonas sp. CC6]CAA7075610.1 2-isopropylmalate synthase (EC [Lentimonas sp. CC4]CAA7168232.1 2-isopropylmalate synthase (EC [Lentimonas sp. CC21]CAA7181616.1 2-isopropylmalate synthase (EC [Lentimonas sp. CC8]
MQTGTITKYRPFQQINLPDRTWPDKTIETAPIWASVDLRDGNQALAIPMTVDEKIDFFELLVATGFKEIEVGFPSASDTEFNFIRRLVEEKRIPKDVTLQVLVQAREHLIRRTFESLEGVPNAIVHLYNSTSPLQRRVTFNKSKEQIKQIAIEGAELIKSLVSTLPGTNVRLQYSPESFSDTEVEYALEICEAVIDVWQPTEANKIILNLPATVEVATPNVHADQIEWFCRNLRARNTAIISLHTHNDRGTGVAATELGLMAGADRVEGTLFGNGERTGNLDIVTVALNLYTQGVDPKLDFSNLERTRTIYERVTSMHVPERHPYAGDLVFTAFSGSHQDAIKKGMDLREKEAQPDSHWQVPYLLIDPEDIGRDYEAIIRINSQSGKGGVAYILSREFGLDLPKVMHPEVGDVVNAAADKGSRELKSDEVHAIFQSEYVNLNTPLELISIEREDFSQTGEVRIQAQVSYKGESYSVAGLGNGPISAFVDALQAKGWKDFTLLDYRQHSIGGGSKTTAAAYIQIQHTNGSVYFGCGINSNIELAGLHALVSAFNRAH